MSSKGEDVHLFVLVKLLGRGTSSYPPIFVNTKSSALVAWRRCSGSGGRGDGVRARGPSRLQGRRTPGLLSSSRSPWSTFRPISELSDLRKLGRVSSDEEMDTSCPV